MFFKLVFGLFICFLFLNLLNCQVPSCETKNNQPGTCRLLKDCPAVLDLIRRQDRSYKVCGYEPSLTVCCPQDVVIQPLRSVETNDKEKPPLERSLHEIKCTEYAKAVFVNEPSKSLSRSDGNKISDKCGNRNVPLIVGGQVASPREFPHMTLIGYLKNNEKVWKCAGTLISDQYVLTAAHCVFTNSFGAALYIRLGELDLSRTDEDSDPEEFDIIEKIVHSLYKEKSKYHDIALLKLNRKVILSPYKRPACLPSSFSGTEKKVIVTGWGKTNWFLNDGSDQLQKVVLDKFNRSICNAIYTQRPNDQLSLGIEENTQICAGSMDEKKDACQGDSGGPMQVYHHSEYCMYTIVGVTSFGISCGNPGIPGVYTRVYQYNDWIERIAWK